MSDTMCNSLSRVVLSIVICCLGAWFEPAGSKSLGRDSYLLRKILERALAREMLGIRDVEFGYPACASDPMITNHGLPATLRFECTPVRLIKQNKAEIVITVHFGDASLCQIVVNETLRDIKTSTLDIRRLIANPNSRQISNWLDDQLVNNEQQVADALVRLSARKIVAVCSR